MSVVIRNTINVSLDLYCSIVCLFIIISLLTSPHKKNKVDICFILTCFCNILICLFDALAWITDASPNPKIFALSKFSEFMYFFVGILIFYCYIRYMLAYVQSDLKRNGFHIATIIVEAIYLIILFTNHFTGAMYSFDENNTYHRGYLYYFTLALEGILYGICMMIVFTNRKKFKSQNRVSFLSFIFFPIITQIIQSRFYGISLITSGCTLSFFIIYIRTNFQIEKNIIEKNTESLLQDKFLTNLQNNTIISLSNLVENRDIETGQHVRRTSAIVELLSKKTQSDQYYKDYLSNEYIKILIKAAPMHDIGKIVVPDDVLKKPGKLTDEEFEIMKSHAKEGGRIVLDILGTVSNKDYIKIAHDMANYHHEKWNGTGYPEHLIEYNIPLCARIMAIADVFDALVSPRCYKKPVPFDEAFSIIESSAGSHFDPILVKEFLLLKDELIHLYTENEG